MESEQTPEEALAAVIDDRDRVIKELWAKIREQDERTEKQQKVIEVVKARIVLMRECAEADLLHVEGLHRAAPARAIREADKALAALEGKPYKEENGG